MKDLDTLIDTKMNSHSPPNIIVLHVGSNDLTEPNLTGKGLIENIKCSLLRYQALFKNVTIIWSSILQRRYWHFAPLNAGPEIDKKRKRVNSAICQFLLGNKGKVIKHDNIMAKEVTLYRTDGTHLSKSGNSIFLNNLQGGLESLLNGNKSVFPE